MYRVPIKFYNKLMAGEIPVAYAVIQTHLGYRAYGEKELTDVFGILRLLADGSVVAGGGETAGMDSTGTIEKSGRIVGIGKFDRTIQPRGRNVLAAWTGKQAQHSSIDLDNADRYFSRLIVAEPFLGRPLTVYVGIESSPQSEHLRVFSGLIAEIGVNRTVMTLEVDER